MSNDDKTTQPREQAAKKIDHLINDWFGSDRFTGLFNLERLRAFATACAAIPVAAPEAPTPGTLAHDRIPGMSPMSPLVPEVAASEQQAVAWRVGLIVHHDKAKAERDAEYYGVGLEPLVLATPAATTASASGALDDWEDGESWGRATAPSRNAAPLTDAELSDPEFVRGYIEGCNDTVDEVFAENKRLRAALTQQSAAQAPTDAKYEVIVDSRDLFDTIRNAWREGQSGGDCGGATDTAENWHKATDYAEGAIKGWSALRAAQASHAGADTERLDWLEKKVVNVRAPLRYGSRDLFWANPEAQDGDEDKPSDIRAQIDAAKAATEQKEKP